MATGTTRNKVALKPGYSLVGWIRLGNSGIDLTGGKRGSITLEELKKHDKIDDCWMAVRGKVYNVTKYLDYHPGGVEQLMRGAGKDATSLFDEYHAWVNIESLLAKCYIGPLKNVVKLDLSDSNGKSKDSATSLSPPSTAFSSLKPIRESDESAIKVPAQINPRFDWIQKKSHLTLFFYLKSFCNPGILLEQICDTECKVTIFIGNVSYAYKFSFYKNLKWPGILKVYQETGKVEILFEKEEAEPWSNYGMHERIKTDCEPKFSEFIITEKKLINHDSFELILRPKTDKAIHFISLGHHVDLKLSMNGKETMRSYTPFPVKYASHGSSQAHFYFLIKKYSFGNMSKQLYEYSSNDSILVSHQIGSFELIKLKPHVNVAFLSAGSGITPFCGLIDHLLERNVNRIENILLCDFNKTERDIWFHEIFNEMTQKDNRFKVKYYLSEPEESWKGECEKISEKVLDELNKFRIKIVLICGPPSFNAEALRILGADSKMETICFQG